MTQRICLLPVAFIVYWMAVNRYDIISVEHLGIIFNLNFIEHKTHLLNFLNLRSSSWKILNLCKSRQKE